MVKKTSIELINLKNPDDMMIKPMELIDIAEMSPLTLNDRRIFNLLLGYAWNNIGKTDAHVISRQDLMKHVDSKNQDIALSFRRLMATVIKIKINPGCENEEIMQMPLLGVNVIETHGSRIAYKFPSELVEIIKKSKIFAKIHTDVMFRISSKYSLTLYEFLQRRSRLKYIDRELLSLDEVRNMLCVPKGKLINFGHLNSRAIEPAVKEVSFLSEYEITANPIKCGRIVTHIQFSWTNKNDPQSQISGFQELQKQKQKQKSYDIILSEKTLEKAKDLIALEKLKIKIHDIKKEFDHYIEKVGFPAKPDAAFIGFVKKKIKEAINSEEIAA